MTDALAKFFASLTFNQLVTLAVIGFIMVMTLIVVIARLPKTSGVEKIKAGPVSIDFDTDDATPKRKPLRRRTKAVKK